MEKENERNHESHESARMKKLGRHFVF